MTELDGLRAQIDAVDSALLELYERRLELALMVGEYKLKNGLPVYDAAREKALYEKREAMAKNSKEGVRELFELLTRHSRSSQYCLIHGAETVPPEGFEQTRTPVAAPTVCYQGEPGAYSEEAASLYFDDASRFINVKSFKEVFEHIAAGKCDYGVLPVENNSTGAIKDVYDLLGEYGFFVVGENAVKVRHCLLGTQDSDIESLREVYSHEQGLYQCGEFLDDYPAITRIPYFDTAGSAGFVAKTGDRKKAAIASARAGAIYGLKTLKSDINTNSHNYTRFFVVSAVPELSAERNKISAVLRLAHQPGSLSRALAALAGDGINLLKLESRPILGKGWEYTFFMDFEGNITDERTRIAIEHVKAYTNYFRILGNYRGYGEAGA